jgi:hypothetical protein
MRQRISRSILVFALALLVFAGGAASTASAPAGTLQAAARSGWSGTIVYTYSYQQHEVRGSSTTDTDDKRRVETIVENGVATTSATYKLTLKETYSWPGCALPAGHNDYTWEAAGTGAVSFVVQPDAGRYMVITGLLPSPGTVTHTNKGHDIACDPVDTSDSQPITENLEVLLPMAGARAAGTMTLSGSLTQPVESKCSGGFDSCSGGGSEDVTWSLVRTKKLELNKVALFDRDPLYPVRSPAEVRKKVKPKEFTPLEFLSASPHPWFKEESALGREGATLVYGTLELDGFAEDTVKSLILEVQWGERKTGADVRAAVIGSGFADGPVRVPKPELLFALPASGFARMNQERNGKLTLRVKVVSEWGDEVVRTLQAEKLVRYSGKNRYQDRDGAYGGDSWVKPHVRKYLEEISRLDRSVDFQWGDMSNMNGGRFYPHASHRGGLDADGFFKGYNNRQRQVTEYAARVLVGLLRTPQGRHIDKIFVTFKPNDAFGRVVQRAGRLPDGRLPGSVVRFEAAHDTHFHIRFKDL